MSSRERTLAILLGAFILVGGGGGAGYLFAYQPIQEKRAAAAKLQTEIDDLKKKQAQWAKDAVRLAQTRRRSLPIDPTDSTRGKIVYADALSRLLPNTIVHVKEGNPDTTGTPLLAPKKPAYTKVQYQVDFDKADLWAVHDFLTAYYKLNLLHQITKFEIKSPESQTGGSRGKPAADRKDLSVSLTTEAIVLDGAENRRTLLPVSSAFYALGGVAGYAAVALSPEAGRGLAPIPYAPVLSTKNRDYTLLVQNDIFHGPLPPPKEFSLTRPTDVAVELDKTIPPVKLAFDGDPGHYGAVKLDAKADSTKWAVKADEKTRTLTVTPPKGETGSTTVTVVAKPARGPEQKYTFKVSVQEPKVTQVKKDDIASTILLIGITTGSDGTALATIRDNANKYKYEVEATAKSKTVTVTKYFYVRDQKRTDRDYKTPKELVISDDWSGTVRHFQVVAVADDGLVLVDLKAGDAKVAPAPKAAAGRTPPGGRDRPKAGPADPLALLVGTAAAAAQTKPAEQPTLYRWAAGKSLKTLTEIPKDEAQKIIQRAAESGPVGATIVAASGE